MIEAAPATASELLASLHARAFPKKPWSAPEIAKLMENQAVFALLHGNGAKPNGFVMAWAAAGDSELLTVAVVPEARRKGVGAALVTSAGVAALVRGAASMHLEVAEDNDGARALYRKLGYEEAGRRHAYYAGEGGSVDAIVMRRALPRPVV
ncbi:MAG: GNAT family N-acetyltransferase [Terricaulis sp.]